MASQRFSLVPEPLRRGEKFASVIPINVVSQHARSSRAHNTFITQNDKEIQARSLANTTQRVGFTAGDLCGSESAMTHHD